MLHLFVDTFFEFGVVENFVYRARIAIILTSDLFRCMSLRLLGLLKITQFGMSDDEIA